MTAGSVFSAGAEAAPAPAPVNGAGGPHPACPSRAATAWPEQSAFGDGRRGIEPLGLLCGHVHYKGTSALETGGRRPEVQSPRLRVPRSVASFPRPRGPRLEPFDHENL